MEAFLTKLLDALKLGVKQYLLVFIVTSIVLFSPKTFTDLVGLTEFVSTYRQFIGVAFLFSGAATLLSVVGKVYKSIKALVDSKKAMKIREERLHKLNHREKELLLYYFINDTNTQSLEYNDGTVRELESYRIITRTSRLSQHGFYFPYNLNPWAREYLTKNPELLKINEIEATRIKQGLNREGWRW